MYDFAEGPDVVRLPRPSWALTALEPLRAPVELSWSLTLDRLSPDSSLGDGRAVLVLPGFSADDFMIGRLRAHLASRSPWWGGASAACSPAGWPAVATGRCAR